MSSSVLARPRATDVPPAKPRRAFQTDIEGLRAIAVLGVVAFHATVPFITGGYAGVDVFFVISGYLISGLLLREALATGRISFKDFYGRRARRILPTASLVLIVTAIASALILTPLAAYRALQDILFSSVYLANWHFIALGTDYLASSTADSPVLHFWSLAVEEQFYIVWPLLVVIAVFVSRKFPLARTRAIFLILGCVAAASFIYSLLLTKSDPTVSYMATTTRGWEFGVGALLAVVAYWLRDRGARQAVFRVAGLVIGWGGLAAVVGSMFVLNSQTSFPGTAALWPTLGTAGIIAGGLLAGTSRGTVGSMLSIRSMRFIGRMSFTWYLWHWPILVLVQARIGNVSWPARVVLCLIALGLSVVTYYVVERPLMTWKVVKTRVSSAIALGLACMVLSVFVTLAAGTLTANAANGSSVAAATVSYTSVFGASNGKNSGAVTPSPLEAKNDIPLPAACLLYKQLSAPPSCDIGDPKGTPVVLFGDSHSNQWLPALQKIGTEHDWHLFIITKSGCPVEDLRFPNTGNSLLGDPDCIAWRQNSINAIVHTIKPKLIIVSSLSTYVPNSTVMLDAWNKSLTKLRALGSPILYIQDTPFPGFDVPECISGSIDNWSKCSFNLTDAKQNEPLPLAVVQGTEPDVHVVDLTSLFCDGDSCPAVRNGTLLYRDDSHISATAAKLLTPALESAMIKAGVLSKK